MERDSIYYLALGFLSYVESCQDSKKLNDKEHLLEQLINILRKLQEDRYN